MVPSRMQIRRWLAVLTHEEILEKLALLRAEHGELDEQDVRHFLNIERKRARDGFVLETPAESDLLNAHEQWKADVAEDLESRQRLYGEPA